jgi:hypothetical protein
VDIFSRPGPTHESSASGAECAEGGQAASGKPTCRARERVNDTGPARWRRSKRLARLGVGRS